MPKIKTPCILHVSTFPPRECGIATFTQDLTTAINKEFNPDIKSKILAMNDNGTSMYNYGKEVVMQIGDSDIEDYLIKAKEINKNSQIKLVNIQHEYGIFGGEWGNYVLPFLEIINKPIVVTFHTVLPRPGRELKKITCDIVNKASGIVVMTKHAAHLLRNHYHIEKRKPVFIIPHGVHHIAYPSKTKSKIKLNLTGRTVLTTFGMLNSDKGIEYAIGALPEIVKKYPDVLYLVLGATHPVVAKHEGEKYRNKLVKLVEKLGLTNNVKFYNKYLDLNELIDYLKATDIYISPTLNPKQAVSGTISYALSCACPIVSTANQYAKDVINNERGILVNFQDSLSIEKALFQILDDPKRRHDMRKSSYFYSRHMTWQNVALSYFKAFDQFTKVIPREKDKLPAINLKHIKVLTDDFGIIQFAKHTKPDLHSGYCLDDNTRALIGCMSLYKKRPSQSLLELIKIYFKYIETSQKEDGEFYDFINHNKTLNKESSSEDSFGRAIWALGMVLKNEKIPDDIKKSAEKILKKSFNKINEIEFPRAMAFSLLGLCEVAKNNELYKKTITSLADKLLEKFLEHSNEKENDKWLWFEDSLTYSNYKIPQSLLMAYKITNNKKYLQIAEKSLSFLETVAFEKDHYNAIGQDGWYYKNGKRAYFDQQPEDTASAVESLVTAYEITGEKKYADQAKLAFAWFLGKNHLNQTMYDEATGGCYDGLGRDSINFNQGAESTISYFLARLFIEDIYKNVKK